MLGAPRSVSLSWVLAVGACSSASTAPPAASAPERGAATAPVVEVTELTVLFDGYPIARLHADGRTESVGDGAPGKDATLLPGPTIHPDGTIVLTKGGLTARVEADGDVFVVAPPGAHLADQRFGRIAGDALLTDDAGDAGVRLEGARLVMFHDGAPTNVLGTIDPPSAGRTALVLTAAFLIDTAITAR